MLKGYTQLRTTCDICKSGIGHQEFDQSQQMIIRLDFIYENKSGSLIFHFISGDNAKRKIKIFDRLCIGENTVSQLILFHIYFDIVREQPLPYPTHYIRFADLSGTVYNQQSFGIGCQIFLNSFTDFSI